MKVLVNKGVISINGKFKEEAKIRALSQKIESETAKNEWIKLHIVEASEGFCSVLNEGYITMGYNSNLYTITEVKEIIRDCKKLVK